MKLNEENGLKLEIKRSEINALEKEWNGLVSGDDNLVDISIKNILNILPVDKSIGIEFYWRNTDKKQKIAYFNKMINDIDTIAIYEKDWIIEEDES